MSIKLMSAIFETEMRDLPYTKDGEERKAKASTAKLVLLALADHANDYGESSYPGYDKLEIKTALSRQGLADTLEALKQNGLLTVDTRGSRLGTNSYTINIRSFPPMYKEIDGLPEVVKPLDSGESSHLTDNSQATGLKPSINHQNNHPKGGLSEKELAQANAKVTAIVENGRKAKYENRDKLPEPLLPFSDVYVELTGQKPSKRVLMDWIATFNDWISEGLQPKDIRAAYQHATRPDGGFLVGRPGSLTNTAVALKSKSLTSAPKIDEGAVTATLDMIEEKYGLNKEYVPPPAWVHEKVKEIAARSAIHKKGIRR